MDAMQGKGGRVVGGLCEVDVDGWPRGAVSHNFIPRLWFEMVTCGSKLYSRPMVRYYAFKVPQYYRFKKELQS